MTSAIILFLRRIKKKGELIEGKVHQQDPDQGLFLCRADFSKENNLCK